mmetsp:Transcript_5863/g.21214  ORF Transcript_5863/g.21214 Transcript_5863/m.21214 type:complete len:289 (-) Transcript_5863:155-1021(-)
MCKKWVVLAFSPLKPRGVSRHLLARSRCYKRVRYFTAVAFGYGVFNNTFPENGHTYPCPGRTAGSGGGAIFASNVLSFSLPCFGGRGGLKARGVSTSASSSSSSSRKRKGGVLSDAENGDNSHAISSSASSLLLPASSSSYASAMSLSFVGVVRWFFFDDVSSASTRARNVAISSSSASLVRACRAVTSRNSRLYPSRKPSTVAAPSSAFSGVNVLVVVGCASRDARRAFARSRHTVTASANCALVARASRSSNDGYSIVIHVDVDVAARARRCASSTSARWSATNPR